MGEKNERGERDPNRFGRGQTAVLGFILLIGVVAVASVGILLVAGEATSELQTESEIERVESAFVELDSELETATASGDVEREMDFDLDPTEGTLEIVENGRLDVLVDGDSIFGPAASNPVPLQSLEYRGIDGHRVAYQGGGVWRGTGAATQRVSSPEVHYRGGTLNLPVTTLDGSTSHPHGEFAIENTDTATHGRYVAGEDVALVVTTPYFGGWTDYFERTFDDADVNVTDADGGYDGAKTVTATLRGVDSFESGTIDAGVIAANEFSAADGASGATIRSDVEAETIDCGQSTTTGPAGTELDCSYQTGGYASTVIDGYPFTSVDDRLEGTIDRAERSGTDLGAITGDARLADSLYYADSVDLSGNDELIVDLADGDVVLAVDGDVAVKAGGGGITIVNATGTDHQFRLYAGGDKALFTGQTAVCVEFCNGKDTGTNWLYASSHTNVLFDSSNTIFEGVVYAPNDPDDDRPYDGDYDVHVSGEPKITGALVGDNVRFEGGPSTKITYDHDLAGVRPHVNDHGAGTADGISFVHVSVRDVDLRAE